MTITHIRRWARSFGIPGLISVAGILFSLFLFPKLAPIWFVQFLGGVGGVLSVAVGQLLSGMFNREWIVGAAFLGSYLTKALEEIETERAFTEAERDALEAFATRVDSMSIETTSVGSNAAVLTMSRNDADQLREIRTQYRKTVMAVPNYEEVYGEEFAESFAAEFGDDLAEMITNGTQLTRPVQELLLKRTTMSAFEREQHLKALATERRSIESVDERLEGAESLLERTDPRWLLHCSFEELLEYEGDLEREKNRYRQLLQTRQREIHESNAWSQQRPNRTFLQEYLYRSLDSPFPALSATLDRIRTLGDRRRVVIRSIARRY